MATQMTDSDASDKLRLAFRMYDEDGSGTVDREEMVEMVSSMYTAQGVAKVGDMVSSSVNFHHKSILLCFINFSHQSTFITSQLSTSIKLIPF